MASSSSSSSQIKRYHVFSSFHGPDVRRGFLSHLHSHFDTKGIKTFKDQEIERGHSIGPELEQAIRESRVSIVVFSKNYASSSWCLDELVQIVNCKETQGQIVMTTFYDVDPSDVRKQKRDFGEAFDKTCQGKTEKVRQRWSNALTEVANIEGEHFLNWPSEAEMIQKIVTDILEKLNLTPSRDVEGTVGIQAHLTKLDSLLCLESDQVKMIGIWGPAGIGKTTIARALYNQLSSSFQLKCFMENIKGSLESRRGGDSRLWLQNQLRSKILSHKDKETYHSDAIKGWLKDQRVLIILDDVDDLEQLEVLAKESSWFGHGSRIIVTTEDKKILKAHGIDDIYHVDFPSEEEALEIFCLSAFKQSYVKDGFEELANKVAKLCGKLPLGLRVVGSSLRGESKQKWELQLSRIEGSLDGKIEKILKVGYDGLSKKDQSLFLHIACFFNYGVDRHVISMLSDSNLDVENGLEALADKSLVNISIFGRIVMHPLLQQLGQQVVIGQSNEPGKRQFLFEAQEIRDVLIKETGTGSVIGISFDGSNMGKVSLSKGAFEGMPNLLFLRIYGFMLCTLQIPTDMNYLPRLRLLHWMNYSRETLPPRFHPDCLVEIRMEYSNLEKLWEGIQPLPNLKTIDLSFSHRLREIPNLSEATNLEKLKLWNCESLVELPSSISNLHKLKSLIMSGCQKLRVIPTNINLASLEYVDMSHCSQLRSFPDISSNIKILNAGYTMIEDVPPSVVGCWFRLEHIWIGNKSLKSLTHAPLSITSLNLSNSDIKMIPDCVISLPHLVDLVVKNCRKLVTIPALSPSLKSLDADDCVSLERVCFSFQNSTKKLLFYNCLKLDEETKKLLFYNCLKLDEEARRGIIQQRVGEICLPGKKIPAEFTHKATGKSITIPLAPGTFSASSRFKACFLILPFTNALCPITRFRLRSKGGVTIYSCEQSWDSLQFHEHLFIFHGDLLPLQSRCHEVDATMSEIIFEFSSEYSDDKIIECGVQINNSVGVGSRTGASDPRWGPPRHLLNHQNGPTNVNKRERGPELGKIGSRAREGLDKRVKRKVKGSPLKPQKEFKLRRYNFETESSSNEVDYYETGGNNNHHTDGDGAYDAEGFKLESWLWSVAEEILGPNQF